MALTLGKDTARLATAAEGWTRITKSADTTIYYVSDSDGDASYDGTSPVHTSGTVGPCKTIMQALTKPTANKPDWVLLKRGDTFADQWFGDTSPSPFTPTNCNGRSATEPFVISSYSGTTPPTTIAADVFTGARPLVYPDSDLVAACMRIRSGAFIATIGIEMWNRYGDPDAPGGVYDSAQQIMKGIQGDAGSVDWFLCEDCYIHKFALNLSFDWAANSDSTYVRRNIITDAWLRTSYSQGIYVARSASAYLEENFFDHNGWDDTTGLPSTSWADSNRFKSHNIYVDNDMPATLALGPATIRGNISVRDGGGHCRSGGFIEDNLFNYHINATLDFMRPFAVGNYFKNNVILQSGGDGSYVYQATKFETHHYDNDTDCPIWNNGTLAVTGNVIAHYTGGTDAQYPALFFMEMTGFGWDATTSGTATITHSITNPVSNAFVEEAPVAFYDTTGSLNGFTHGQTYYVRNYNDTAKTFNLSATTPGGALLTIIGSNTGSRAGYLLDSAHRNVTVSGNTIYKYSGVGDGNTRTMSIQRKLAHLDFIPLGDNPNIVLGTNLIDRAPTNNGIITSPPYLDPERTIATYMGSLGLTATEDAFYAACKARAAGVWDTRFAANTVNNYIRAGFNMAAIGVGSTSNQILMAQACM